MWSRAVPAMVALVAIGCPVLGLASTVCPESSYVTVSFGCTFPGEYRHGLPYNVLTIAPFGNGDPFETTQILIRAFLRDCQGAPVPDVPADQVELRNDSLCMCTPKIADAPTSQDGTTTFSGTIRGGGWVSQLRLYAEGMSIGTVPVRTNGPRVVANQQNCSVDVNALSTFAADYRSETGDTHYNIRSDYDEDGFVDIVDLILFNGRFLPSDCAHGPTKVAAAILPGPTAEVAPSPKIGVFFDPEGKSCSKQIGLGDSGIFYVLAIQDLGTAPSELLGAEFRVTGLPTGMNTSLVSEPESFATGDAFSGGMSMGFKSCRTGSRIVQLAHFNYFAFAAVPQNVVLRVEAASPPSNRLYDYPFVVLCEKPSVCGKQVPNIPRLGARGLESVINGTCTVDTEQRRLSQARLSTWPNPTRGGMQMRFDLPRSGKVALQVFDLLGRRVRRVMNRSVDPGSYTASWDGRDERGRPLPAGVYFIRLTDPSGAVQRPVTLLR